MRIKLSFFVLFILYPFMILKTQVEMNWKDCIQYACENNLEIKNNKLISEQYEYRLSTARLGMLPTLNARSDLNYSFGKSIDKNTNDIVYETNIFNSFGLSSSVRLFSGFSRVYTINLLNYNLHYSREKEVYYKNQVGFSILTQCCNVLLYAELSDMLEQKIQNSIDQLERLKTFYKYGRIAGTELVDMEAQLARDSLIYKQNSSMLSQAEFDLKEEMNMSVDQEIEMKRIEISTDEQFPFFDDSTIIASILDLPQTKMAEYILQSQKESLKIERGKAMPVINAGAGFSTDYFRNANVSGAPAYSKQLGENLSEYVGISLSIPIFNGMSSRNAINEAKIAVKIRENDLLNQIRILENEIRQSVIDFESSKAEYLSAKRNLESQEMAFKSATKRLEKGLIDVLAFNLVQNNLVNAKVELLRAELQLFMISKKVEFYRTGNIL